MYAIIFDLEIEALKKHYNEPYHKAYFEIKSELEKYGFIWKYSNFYLSDKDLTAVYSAIKKLSKIKWFKDSVLILAYLKLMIGQILQILLKIIK
ncbi:virulence protein [Pasteurella skyensis]|uniref:Virulence protein n=1 Tax=Phocoenobacter skyensis TaxID=97481 RepID=A0AAJ6NBN4_9PAST|nr:virulence protein [Pasteurella skyensis]MDP8163487.1 virulence protein [Pasteurella skyensis]MDP8173802.1 virulence protein [Pasteurella skyensis]MDP8179951.1 virulence protein [Pasteurella skyensis]MDP8182648.1 virulence protein [Pasteurella skyensis]MDP8182661.1 virulence protein [Pasteurella skyensis]